MKISVVCPTFNSESFVETTLLSVLAQTRLPEEIIIVDDGSFDDTLKILKKFQSKHKSLIPIQIFEMNHRGPGAARNKGIKSANCEWIAFLDSDDTWHPSKLDRVQRNIGNSKQVNFICHDEILSNISGKETEMRHSFNFRDTCPLKKQLYFKNFISTSTVVCKKSLLTENDLFDESLMSAQDYDLWLKLSPSMNLLVIRETLGKYIERKGNITSGKLRLRLLNDLKISWRHRHDIPRTIVCLRYLRIFISYLKQLISRIFL